MQTVKIGILSLAMALAMLSLVACSENTTPSSEASNNSAIETSTSPDESVPLEIDLGDMGKLNFEVPKQFEDKLKTTLTDNSVAVDGSMQYIELFLSSSDNPEPAFSMVLMEQALNEKMANEDSWVQPLEILVEDDYLLGYWNLQFNPFEDETDSAEYALMQDYDQLKTCIIDSMVWTR